MSTTHDIIALGRPTLHLSGPKLRAALEALIQAAEAVGGVERLAEAVTLKGRVLSDRLGNGKAATLARADFEAIAVLMATVRRRIGRLLGGQRWPSVRAAIVTLLDNAHVPGTEDRRMAAFETALAPLYSTGEEDRVERRGPALIAGLSESSGASGIRLAAEAAPGAVKVQRFIRDLAAEILHGVEPQHYPLMTRWVWDANANTGVLREIWHDPSTGDDVDRMHIDVPDGHATFLVFREELSQFLADNGIFRDMLGYVDLLQAQIYSDYINAQGGAYLKTDFTSGATDPLEHTRRILGLDLRDKRIGDRQ